MKNEDVLPHAKGIATKYWNKITGAVSTLAAVRASKYGYSYARVSSMKSLLLKKELLQELARMRTVDAIVEMLERTYYKDNLTKLSISRHGSELVQVAIARHFAQIAEKLMRITPKSDKQILDIMLIKWDIINAKIILQARFLGKKYEDMALFLIPIGSFSDENEAKSLFEGKGEALFLKFVKTKLGKQIIDSGVVSSTELEKIFLNMDSAAILKLKTILDLFYYSLYEKSGIFSFHDLEPIGKIFAMEIDLKNASIIIRFKQHNINDPKVIEKYLIKGGRKKLNSFAPMINAASVQESLKIAAKMFNLKNVPGDVIELEKALNNTLAAAKLKVFYRSMLSVGTILGFLFLKEEEINNIRKIVIGKEYNIPDQQIEEMLVFQN